MGISEFINNFTEEMAERRMEIFFAKNFFNELNMLFDAHSFENCIDGIGVYHELKSAQ